jgi:hypothetical protein
MNKQEIIQKLIKNHTEFVELIIGLNDTDFLFSFNNKWTAGQQLDHIYRSVAPVKMAFTLPKFIPGLLFGKANRPSRDYTSLVEKYKSKLETGGVASGRFVPPSISVNQKEKLKKQVLKTVNTLTKKINRYTEQQLDEYILPHPLLGKLTMREMLFFTIHHVEQHQAITSRNLQQK